MGFKRNDSIGSVLEQNHKMNNDDVVVLKKKVREKLDKLVEYDYDSDALSAASYLSDMIEQRYNDLNIEKYLK